MFHVMQCCDAGVSGVSACVRARDGCQCVLCKDANSLGRRRMKQPHKNKNGLSHSRNTVLRCRCLWCLCLCTCAMGANGRCGDVQAALDDAERGKHARVFRRDSLSFAPTWTKCDVRDFRASSRSRALPLLPTLCTLIVLSSLLSLRSICAQTAADQHTAETCEEQDCKLVAGASHRMDVRSAESARRTSGLGTTTSGRVHLWSAPVPAGRVAQLCGQGRRGARPALVCLASLAPHQHTAFSSRSIGTQQRRLVLAQAEPDGPKRRGDRSTGWNPLGWLQQLTGNVKLQPGLRIAFNLAGEYTGTRAGRRGTRKSYGERDVAEPTTSCLCQLPQHASPRSTHRILVYSAHRQ